MGERKMATKKKEKTQKLTFLLMRNGVASAKDALRTPSALQKIALKSGTGPSGEFWYAKPATKTPGWLSFVTPVLAKAPPALKGATLSAVLFVKAKGRLFAVTFGYGRNLLKPDSFELGFGLRSALNRLDHRRIRSLDLKNYEDLVLATKKQTSRNSELGTFGLDVARDLVSAVTGEPSDSSFAKRITGADACTLNAAITAGGLGKKCEQLFDAWGDTSYKTHFEWIDHLNEVRDAALVAKLNEALLKALKSKKTDLLHLAPAEPIDWQEVDGFRMSGTRTNEYDELDLDQYLANLGDKAKELTIDKLKSYRVQVRWTGNDSFQSKWTIYSCLVWETTLNKSLYALVDGRWFEVEKSFAKRVRKFVKALPLPATPLPDAVAGEKEETYNERIAAKNGNLVCLDQNLVKPTDAATSIEFCDILSKQKQMVHVKKKTRSATLSHLFAQGTVAAREFLQDGPFRDQIRQKLKAKTGKTGFVSLVPASNSRPIASEYEVAYAIIAKPNSNWPASLPFFSQLNLMQHAKLLHGLGYRVTLQLVPEK
jgi:uncharacterized protein (TIGR04141 family)